MHESIARLARGLDLRGDLRVSSRAFLVAHGLEFTAAHCAEVADEARRLALRFGLDPGEAEAAGLLHDISAPIPNAERVAVAEAHGMHVLDAERHAPMIVHQRLSAVLASELFGITNPAVLGAVACHTTLKRSATSLDKIVFVADKIRWDQVGAPPYRSELLAALDDSLDAGVWTYLGFLWQRRASLAVIHPWLVEAIDDFHRRGFT